MLKNITGGPYKRGNKQDNNNNSDNVRLLASRGKKIATINAKAAKPAIRKQLTISIKAAWKKKVQDQCNKWDVNIRKVYMKIKLNE